MDRPNEVGPETPARSAAVRVRRSGPRIFAVAFLVFFGAGAIWSAATPLLGAPDEPSQMIKAVSVAHGRWTATCYIPKAGACDYTSSSLALGFEELIPTFYNLIIAPLPPGENDAQTCFKQKTSPPGRVAASCARSLDRSPTAFDLSQKDNLYSSTYQARYPPLYYAIVGLPGLFPGSTVDLYLMRLISAALSALFLAAALTCALVYSRNRLLIVGLAVAATPMVFFLGGVVNPSGLEITAAISLWVAGAVLVTERLSDRPVGLVATVGISAAVLESIRALSPFWLVCIVVALVACGPRRQLVTAVGSRRLLVCIGSVALIGVLALWWTTAVHATDLYLAGNTAVPRSVSSTTIFENVLKRNRYYLPDMVGVFGWFDTYSPPLTYVLWYVLAGGLFLLAALRAGRRAIVLGAVLVATLVIPALIVTSHAHLDGYTWQGRDAMPLAVGLPILAGAILGTGGRAIPAAWFRRGVPVVVGAAALAQFLAFYESVRRYAVGTTGPIFGFLTHPSWQPAISNVGALALEAAALVVLSALYWWSASRPTDPDGVTGPDVATPIPGTGGDGSSVSAANTLKGA